MVTPAGSVNERALIPGIIITVAAFLAGCFFFLNSGDKKVSVKVFIIYTLATVLLFGFMGLTVLINIENPMKYFIWTEIGMFALGIGHVFALGYVNTGDKEGVFWQEIIFTVYVLCLGGCVYLFLRAWVGQPGGYNLFLLNALLFFVVPFFVMKTFDFLVAIPSEEYEKWYFPVEKNFEDDNVEEDFDDKKTIVLKFEIKGQKMGDNKLVSTDVLAPLKYDFGNFFAFILYSYNDSNAGKQIQYLDEYGQPIGWNFYVKPKWYQTPRYIDPKLSVFDNEINEKAVIVCERV